MAASAKSERDNAASVLRQALRRLDSLTKEKQIKAAMVTAEQQYTETIRLHIQYCSKKGEDQNAGAHLEWENTVGDSFNKSYTEAEDKLEVLRVAQQPPELTAKVKMNRTKAEIAVSEVEINSDIAALTEAVQAATLGKEAHDGLVVERAKVDSRLTEHRVKSDQLLDLAMVSGEAEPEITALVENQKKFRTDLVPKLTSITTNLISKKPAETSQAPPRSGGGVRHDAAMVVGHGVEAPIPGSQRKQFIKYRPKEMPKFTVKAKDFALWKKLWQEGISPQFEGRTDVPKDHDDEAQINDMGNGPIELSTLPEELLLRILKLLSHSDLSNLMLVNKKFNNLASDPALWRQYHIPVKEISELSGLDVLGRVLQLSRFSKLQYLDLHEVRDAVLRKKAFYFFGQDSAIINSAISQQFQDILITASTLPLKRLDLSCYNNLAAIPAPDILSKLVLGIEHVELADSWLGPQILSDILEGISDTSVLRNVDFRYCEFDSLPVHLIPKLNCLTNVSLEGSIMTTEQVKALLMEMGRGSKIVKLDLGYDSIEDVETRWDAFESVEPEVVAKALNNVEYLIKNRLSDVHLAAFLQEMGRKTKLKKIEMLCVKSL